MSKEFYHEPEGREMLCSLAIVIFGGATQFFSKFTQQEAQAEKHADAGQ